MIYDFFIFTNSEFQGTDYSFKRSNFMCGPSTLFFTNNCFFSASSVSRRWDLFSKRIFKISSAATSVFCISIELSLTCFIDVCAFCECKTKIFQFFLDKLCPSTALRHFLSHSVSIADITAASY